jgi:hypothetical protein
MQVVAVGPLRCEKRTTSSGERGQEPTRMSGTTSCQLSVHFLWCGVRETNS